MSRIMGACALVAAVLAAAPVQAQTASTVVNRFAEMCADNPGDPEKALALAQAARWQEFPASAFAGANVPLRNLRARLGQEGDAVVMLMVGEMDQQVEGMTMHMKTCGLVVQPARRGASLDPDPRAVVREWLGMRPHRDLSARGMTGYAFTVADGRRESLEGRSDLSLAQAALSGEINMIMVGEMEGATVLFYGVPTF